MTEYDYVIVGAGSAGCVLANRLSQDSTVLLLEAGGPDDKREISIPIAHPELLQTDVDWGFHTTNQPRLQDRSLYVPQGKTLGGSSSINAQLYFRGHPADYDAWAAAGNAGWEFDTIVADFERVEDGPQPYYGTGGPQHIAPVESPHPITEAFIKAAVETGLQRRPCLNTREITGVGYTDSIRKDGQRFSAADAFLKPVLDRSSLTTETGAEVRRVLFDGDQATGVRYVQDGETGEAEATEEVILSAGAINSPRVLMHSGVGPADHLRDHGLEVQVDLPGVGRNLHDHALVWTHYESQSTETYDDADSILNLLKYLVLKRGPLTSHGAEAGGYWQSEDGIEAPDIQFLFAPALVERNGLRDPSGRGFSLATALIHPESRGRLTLSSADPTADPVIDPQYLTEDRDFEALVSGVMKSREIASATPLSEYWSGGAWPQEADEEAIREHIREHMVPYYHFVGSCKMGSDDMAVVDDRLRVHGVKGLRVIDTSVMPTIPRANTHAPTLMIAERAARFIRGAG